MRKPTVTVAIIEDNATRAELYGHWLDHMEVRIALTKRQVVDVVDSDLTVAVLAEEFGGEAAAPKVLELIRSRTRFCQVVTTTTDRDQIVPQLDVDNHFTKPIFEEDLTAKVERLARQSVFCEILTEYYRTTAKLTALRRSDDAGDPEREDRLEAKVSDLKPMITGLRAELDSDDMATVADLVAGDEPPDSEADEGSSKYMPEKCYQCGRNWGVGAGTDASKGVVRLGSQVWRCTNCGHIQMGSTAGNPRLTHSQ